MITHHTPKSQCIDSLMVRLFTGTWCRVTRIKSSVYDVTGIRLVRDVTGVQP
jgi:hypothetical protein